MKFSFIHLIRFRVDNASVSGNSRIKKVGWGHCGAKEKVGGQLKCLSYMVIFRCFEDEVSMINPIKPNIGL